MDSDQLKQDFNDSLQKAQAFYQNELRSLKTGRATPSMIESLSVNCYGSVMPLVQLASINAPEPSQLTVKPWDKTNLKDINKALETADLGATCSIDGDIIRVRFAPPTEERRKELVKKIKEKLEETRVKVRLARDKVRDGFNTLSTEGEMSEDEKFRLLSEVDKKTKETNEALQAVAEKKEAEVMTI
ncbi:MAG: ribosome recycling factor [Candidatus Komeilibacteria bacterium]|nr:ribosome recycling factor [Candidatus Komeilibacteria bacterium]